MNFNTKEAVVFIIFATAVSVNGVEINYRREPVRCNQVPGHMKARLSSSHSLAVKGPSIKDIANETSPITCWLGLIADEGGSFLLEIRAFSLGVSARTLTFSMQRANGTVMFRNHSSAGPLWLLPAEEGDQLNVTWRIADNSSPELHASFLTNSSCGDDSMVNFRNACYVVRSVADFGDSSSQMLEKFGAQFQDKEQLRAFVHDAVPKSPTLKNYLTTPVLLGMKFRNGQLMYQSRTDKQYQWTEFRGSNGSNLTRNVILGATEVEHPWLVTLLVNGSSEPVLGLISSSKEAASSGQHQVLLKFIPASELSKCNANNNSSNNNNSTADKADSKLGVTLGCIAAAVVIAAVVIVTAAAILLRRRCNLPCPTSSCCTTHNNGSANGGTQANNGACNGDAAASGRLLGPQQKKANSLV